jgi:hypothetical protein
VTFANPLPWWALAAVIAGAAAIAWLAYSRAPIGRRKRAALAAVRFVSLIVLLLLLMRPIARGGADVADAVVPILVDTSRSMSLEDMEGLRRIDVARTILTGELLPALAPRFRTEVLGFGETLAPSSPAELGASARRSDLAGALEAVRERYRGQVIAGVVVISDGGDTGGAIGRGTPEAAVPVYPLGVGARAIGRDREVLSVTTAEAVLDDSRVDLAVSAVSHGHGSAPIELRLLENGRIMEVRRPVPAAEGSPVREIFHVTPGKGAPSIYTIEIPAESRELVPENNTRSVLVQPPARPRRILLIQGAPGFEHSFLRRAWSGDSGLEVDAVVRKGKNETGSDTFYIQAASSRSAALVSGYPDRREALFAYDAVVLANMEGTFLTSSQLEETREFVGRRGGGLLVLGAQSFLRPGLADGALAELLPLDLGERGRGVLPASAQSPRAANRVGLTAAGESHPIMQLTGSTGDTRKRWDAVPALASIAPLGGPRPGATVLAVTSGAGGTPRALVAVQRYGEGRSMVFTGEAAWRWRMLLPAADRSYDTFWRQAVRWLALPATDPVNIVAPAGAAPGDVLDLRVSARSPAFDALRNPTVDVRVTRPDGRVDSVPAVPDTTEENEGTFVARYRADEAGVYRATADVRGPDGPAVAAATSILVGGADPEMTDPRLNLHVLQRIASASGGRMVEQGKAADLADRLQSSLPAAAERLRASQDLWHTGWSFGAILCLLAAEWLLRRRWGLR